MRDALAARVTQVGLELHPDKPRILYCKDADRRGSHEHTSFTFLGYRFRPRLSKNRYGKHFVNFLPAVSNEAIKGMGKEIRSWRIACRSDMSLVDLAQMCNNIAPGWVNYYGHFYKSMLYPLLRRSRLNYFKRAVCKAALSSLASFTRHRLISWWMALRRWKWKDVRRRFTDHTGRWQKPSADGIELFDLQAVTVTRYRYRGNTTSNPWTHPNPARTAESVESPVLGDGYAAFGERHGGTDRWQHRHRAPCRLNRHPPLRRERGKRFRGEATVSASHGLFCTSRRCSWGFENRPGTESSRPSSSAAGRS
ncbi:group II intron maturase-specific domain-containing protein [Streptomyces iranensis]|uniref:Group II intron maturase-specific domain-containing protein n=1 Tax=Streptomyces iranensis TaxID=576784 RepID=A0ABS4N9Z5_9ACTN|nr:group II intron maturase-specific domain-containing protein [Streptomyces iranensis]MBP2068838.1 hypothetical protein [Streptomyces iranensis]